MNKKVEELRQRNNELYKQVSFENAEVLTDIVRYIQKADISERDKEVARHDLLEAVLSAQEKGEDIRTVIGDDYKAFCNNIIAGLPSKGRKYRIIDFFDQLCIYVSLLVLICVIISKDFLTFIRNLFTGQPLNFQLSFTGATIIYCIVIGVAYYFIINNLLRQKKWKRFVVALAGLVIIVVLAYIAALLRNVIFTVNIFAALAPALVLYCAHIILSRLEK